MTNCDGRHRRAGFVVAGMAIVLSACVGGSQVPERAIYDFGVVPPAAVGAAAPLAVPLRVDLVMPTWLDGTDILYRLDYDESARLRAYAGSRWAGRPGQLIAARLKERFAGGVLRCAVRVEIEEFSQHFSGADASRQVLVARWTLLGPRGERLFGETSQHVAATASADARGGVAAAAQTVNDLAANIARRAGDIEACRP